MLNCERMPAGVVGLAALFEAVSAAAEEELAAAEDELAIVSLLL
jgi:hypothetical protein